MKNNILDINLNLSFEAGFLYKKGFSITEKPFCCEL